MRPLTLTLTLALGLAAGAACSGTTTAAGPEVDAAAAGLEVALAKASYTRADLDITSGPGARARIVNGTGRAYYSRLGDAFNGAAEQDPVWVSNGSDGALERADGAAWVAVQGPQMVEGVREVTLRAGKSYELIVHAAPGVASGTYRVVVGFRAAPGAPVSARVASAPFEVR